MSREDFEIWSTPQVVLNNRTINIVPGSLMIKLGRGEQSVKAQSAGGGAMALVYSDNVETKIAEVKFKLFSTPANISLYDQTKSNNPSNAVSATHPTLNVSYHFGTATCISDAEINAQPDGEFELHFKSLPAV